MRKIIFLIIFCLISLSHAQAFIFLRGGYEIGERPVSKAPYWNDRVLRFHINTDLSNFSGSITPDVTSSEFISAIYQAAQAWNGICNSNVRVEITGTSLVDDDPNDLVNIIAWDNRSTAENNSFSSTGVLAEARTIISTLGRLVDCDIVINGHVQGTVRGLKVRLTSSARVEGDIIHKTIAIESGAQFEGTVQRQDDPLASGRSSGAQSSSRRAAVAQHPAIRKFPPFGVTEQKPSSIKVASAGGVDDFFYLRGWHFFIHRLRHNDTALFAHGDGHHFTHAAHLFNSKADIIAFIQRQYLRFVGK
jgi:hypothetical protein